MQRTTALAFFFSLPLLAEPAIAGQIEWEVANRFQQFKNEDDFQNLKNAWPKQASAQEFLARQNAASLRTLLPVKNTWWNAKTGLYDNAGLFKPFHDILISYAGNGKGRMCEWSINGKSLRAPVPCEQTVRVRDLEEKKPFDLAVKTSEGESLFLQSKGIEVSLILAVGDSFASGEGNPDHAAVVTTQADKASVAGRDWFLDPDMGNFRFTKGAVWWDTACHRSMLSWQSLYAMKKAVMNPGQVVRFASFACSGAEVYDGFFRAQIDPPADLLELDEVSRGNRVAKVKARDGGNFMVTHSFKNTPNQPATRITSEQNRNKTVLNKSQLNAAIALLCDGKTNPGLSKYFLQQQEGLRKSPYYGVVYYDKCQGTKRIPDEVLVSFGGNDFGFSGVVSWGLTPSTPVRSRFKLFPGKGLALLRGFTVQDPIEAGAAAKLHMGLIYDDVAWAFSNILNAKPQIVRELVYPNPFPDVLSESCSGRMAVGNVALTQHFMKRGSQYPIISHYLKNFIFRIENKDAEIISKNFIQPLQQSQRIAIKAVGWKGIESEKGFESPVGKRTICAVAPACEKGKECTVADLSGWAHEKDSIDPSLTPLSAVTEWEPYDSTRVRGLRYSNDSVMTQARFKGKNNTINDDWFNGSVHPVAAVHAGIADSPDLDQ